ITSAGAQPDPVLAVNKARARDDRKRAGELVPKRDDPERAEGNDFAPDAELQRLDQLVIVRVRKIEGVEIERRVRAAVTGQIDFGVEGGLRTPDGNAGGVGG